MMNPWPPPLASPLAVPDQSASTKAPGSSDHLRPWDDQGHPSDGHGDPGARLGRTQRRAQGHFPPGARDVTVALEAAIPARRLFRETAADPGKHASSSKFPAFG